MSDLVLYSDVEAAMRGDAEAFRRVVERTAATVSSIAFAVVRDVDTSEDVAQDVYLSVWRNLPRLRDPRKFMPWLCQIARNRARSSRRRAAAADRADHPLETIEDRRSIASDRMLRDEEQQILNRVLERLPEKTRELVLLYYREESSTQQVSQRLGITEAAARQRLSRARAAIRGELLEAFGAAARRTAPGAVFVAAVAGAATAAAPSASAAVVAGAAQKAASSSAKALFAFKSAAAGLLLGTAGVFMSLVHLGDPFDEEEKRDLHVLSAQALVIFAIFAAAFTAADAAGSRWWRLGIYLAYLSAMIALYRIRLPRILARRYAWEASVDPAAADRHAMAWSIWRSGELARALGAAMSGGILFALLLHWIPR